MSNSENKDQAQSLGNIINASTEYSTSGNSNTFHEEKANSDSMDFSASPSLSSNTPQPTSIPQKQTYLNSKVLSRDSQEAIANSPCDTKTTIESQVLSRKRRAQSITSSASTSSNHSATTKHEPHNPSTLASGSQKSASVNTTTTTFNPKDSSSSVPPPPSYQSTLLRPNQKRYHSHNPEDLEQCSNSHKLSVIRQATRTLAAMTIQRQWRNHVAQPTIKKWVDFNISVKSMRSMCRDFNDATKIIQRRDVVLAASGLIKVLFKTRSTTVANTAKSDSDPLSGYKIPPGRLLMTAYLVSIFPESITNGPPNVPPASTVTETTLSGLSNNNNDDDNGINSGFTNLADCEDTMINNAKSLVDYIDQYVELAYIARLPRNNSNNLPLLDAKEENGRNEEGKEEGGYISDGRVSLNNIHVSILTSYRAFYESFEAWKTKDTNFLIESMSMHYLELDKLWQTVQKRTMGKGDEAWRQSIADQRKDILERIRKIGNDEIVAKLLERQEIERNGYDILQPSITPSAPPLPQQPGSHYSNSVALGNSSSNYSDSVPSRPPSSTLGISEKLADIQVIDKSNEDRRDLEKQASQSSKIDDVFNSLFNRHPASSSSSSNSDKTNIIWQNNAISVKLENARLAHEIILDPDFKLNDLSSNGGLVEQVRTIATKAFFDIVQQDIDKGNTKWILRLVGNLKDELMDLLPKNKNQSSNKSSSSLAYMNGSTTASNLLVEQVEARLDAEHIEELVNSGDWTMDDVRQLLEFVVDTMGRVCAPVRDQDISNLKTKLRNASDNSTSSSSLSFDSHKLVDITKDILSLLQLMKSDSLNFHIQHIIRPYLNIHAVEYEQKLFTDLLKHKTHTHITDTHRTEKWLKSSLSALDNETDTTNSETLDTSILVAHGLLDLVFTDKPLPQSELPETLYLDDIRIHKLQNSLQSIIIIASLTTICRQLSPRFQNQPVEDTKKVVGSWLHLLKSNGTRLEDIVIAVEKSIYSDGDDDDDGGQGQQKKEDTDRDKLKTLVRNCLSTTDPIYMTIAKYIKQTAIKIFSSTSTSITNTTTTNTMTSNDNNTNVISIKKAANAANFNAFSLRISESELKSKGLYVVTEELDRFVDEIYRLSIYNTKVYQNWYNSILN